MRRPSDVLASLRIGWLVSDRRARWFGPDPLAATPGEIRAISSRMPAFLSTIGDGPAKVDAAVQKAKAADDELPFYGGGAGRAWGVMAQIRQSSPDMTTIAAGQTVSEYCRQLLARDVATFEKRAAVLRRDAAAEPDAEVAARRLVIARQLDRLANDYRVLLVISAPRAVHNAHRT